MKRLFAGGWGSHAAALGLEPSYQVEGESVDPWVAQGIIGSGAADWEASDVGRRVPGHWARVLAGYYKVEAPPGGTRWGPNGWPEPWEDQSEWEPYYDLVWVPDMSPIHGDRIPGELGAAAVYPIAKGLIKAYEGTKNYVSDVARHPGTPTPEDIGDFLGAAAEASKPTPWAPYITAASYVYQFFMMIPEGEGSRYWGYSYSKYQMLQYLMWTSNFRTP